MLKNRSLVWTYPANLEHCRQDLSKTGWRVTPGFVDDKYKDSSIRKHDIEYLSILTHKHVRYTGLGWYT